MIAAPNATIRELAAIGARSQAAPEAKRPRERAYIAPEHRRRLRMMKLRDGRVHLLDDKGIYLTCANERIARAMKAVFSR